MSNSIEWKIEISDNVHSLIMVFENIDSSIFSNREFMQSLWKDTYEQISEFIKKKFEEGKSSWRPLTPKYAKWKTSAVSKGKKVNAGSFGKRVCKLNEMGRLTNTMFTSATEKADANIFEVKDSPRFSGGSFRYAISGSKLPHAVYFDNSRPFFFLSEEESNEVLDKVGMGILNKVEDIWEKT